MSLSEGSNNLSLERLDDVRSRDPLLSLKKALCDDFNHLSDAEKRNALLLARMALRGLLSGDGEAEGLDLHDAEVQEITGNPATKPGLSESIRKKFCRWIMLHYLAPEAIHDESSI